MAIIATSTPYRIDKPGLELLQMFGFVVTPGSVSHTHPISAMLRNGFEEMVFKNHPGELVKDIGGNPARHAKNNHMRVDKQRRVHACCPFTCPADVVREVSRNVTHPLVSVCRNKFTTNTGMLACKEHAGVYMFNHSMYYITKRELLVLPVGTVIYSMHHVFPDYDHNASYCNNELHVSVSGEHVVAYGEGNDLPYEHPNCWLSGECVLPGNNGSVIAFKLMAKYETCHVFKGVVMDVGSYPANLYLEPGAPSVKLYWNELEKYLLSEVVGTTIDARTIHVLHARARTYCVTKDRPIPRDLSGIITRVLNKAARETLRMQDNLNLDMITASNLVVGDVMTKMAPDTVPWYRRLGTSALSITRAGVKSLGYVLATPLVEARRHSVDFSRYAYSRFVGIRTLWNSMALVETAPQVPQRCWENEFTAIVKRAVAPEIRPIVDQSITAAALELARHLGPLLEPIPFEDWIARYPPSRRERLRTARLEHPLSSDVRMFLKVEKLDKQSDPRAIQARHDTFLSCVGPWIAALEERARAVLPIFVKGMDLPAQARKIAQLRSRANNTVEIDFQRFDRHCSRPLLEATEHLIYSKCFPPAVAQVLQLALTNNVTSHFGARYQVEGTRMSGDVMTSIGNCLVVTCLMLAAKLPLDSMVVEGDDMLAALTDKEKADLDMRVVQATGMRPEVIVTHQGGSFCSRYDVINSDGNPTRVRHPLRDITRFGVSVHDASQIELVRSHAMEWNGVPMLGPVYVQQLQELDPSERDNPQWTTDISAKARACFQIVFGIGPEDQIAFEEDPKQRQPIYTRLEDATRWQSDCSACPSFKTAPSATGSSDTGGDTASKVSGVAHTGGVHVKRPKVSSARLSSGSDGNGSSRRSRRALRDVQDTCGEVHL